MIKFSQRPDQFFERHIDQIVAKCWRIQSRLRCGWLPKFNRFFLVHRHISGKILTKFRSWCCGRVSDLRSRGHGFESRPGTTAKKLRASFSHLCASVSKQYNLVRAWGRWCLTDGKVTVGLAESNGRLPPGLWLCMSVTVGLVGGGESPPPGSWLCMLSPAGWLPRVRISSGPYARLRVWVPLPLPFTNQ